MKKSYGTLLFDLDGTLLDFHRAEREGFQQVLKTFGFPVTEENVNLYHEINARCWREYEKGALSREQVLAERFLRFFAAAGAVPEGLPAEEEREFSLARAMKAEKVYRELLGRSAYVIGGAREILDFIKERGTFRVCAVTNGVADTQRRRLKDSGLDRYFDEIFISEELGVQKPKRQFFDKCFDVLGAEFKGGALVIGDSLTSDMKGAAGAGIDSCWYNPSGEENTLKVPVTWEIRDLSELENIL